MRSTDTLQRLRAVVVACIEHDDDCESESESEHER
jgi:hypothetical protein